MAKAIDDLKSEHEGIKQALTILERMISGPRKDIKSRLDDMRGLIEFFRIFADKCHHGKEEQYLFKELEKAGYSASAGPVKVMLDEHSVGRSYLKQMAAAVEAWNGMKAIPNEISVAALNYISLLRAHIEKENNVLFLLAEKALSKDVDVQLEAEFEQFEDKVIGRGRHEEIHTLLQELSQKYLQ
jgi:hemerythrin-like domain-containing protein